MKSFTHHVVDKNLIPLMISGWREAKQVNWDQNSNSGVCLCVLVCLSKRDRTSVCLCSCLCVCGQKGWSKARGRERKVFWAYQSQHIASTHTHTNTHFTSTQTTSRECQDVKCFIFFCSFVWEFSDIFCHYVNYESVSTANGFTNQRRLIFDLSPLLSILILLFCVFFPTRLLFEIQSENLWCLEWPSSHDAGTTNHSVFNTQLFCLEKHLSVGQDVRITVEVDVNTWDRGRVWVFMGWIY